MQNKNDTIMHIVLIQRELEKMVIGIRWVEFNYISSPVVCNVCFSADKIKAIYDSLLSALILFLATHMLYHQEKKK